mgnify:CR=1 FL=1
MKTDEAKRLQEEIANMIVLRKRPDEIINKMLDAVNANIEETLRTGPNTYMRGYHAVSYTHLTLPTT